MTVYFIGAGPGAPDLITLRGRDLIARCPLVLYAGSLVPQEILAHAAPGARLIDSAALTLEEIVSAMVETTRNGEDVARVHSGDPSLYGAIAEQMRRLDEQGIDYEVVPGVPAFAAAAAALKTELTLPGVSQTVILTRTAMKASPMPEGEELAELGRSGATLAVHLSIRNLRALQEALIPHYGADCPVAVVYRASWPDERVIRTTLGEVRAQVRAAKITRTALVLVGRVLDAEGFRDSALYDPAHVHLLRPRRRG
jgi:precorrin-4/cobalt-precorrin-4 C11-methyltransferase